MNLCKVISGQDSGRVKIRYKYVGNDNINPSFGIVVNSFGGKGGNLGRGGVGGEKGSGRNCFLRPDPGPGKKGGNGKNGKSGEGGIDTKPSIEEIR